ncbi:MAG TPA: FHA domain-containing protein [Pyrinomonadaceae bacterium]|nr:FHA domain-containing protein [Pyrinomonadaceae bacterium]
MQTVTLKIDSPDGSQSIELADEITIGRTDAASLTLSDTGLSRRNTTIFRDGDDVLVVDEGSTNGTFLNGKQMGSSPVIVRNGDTLRLGTYTTIAIQIGAEEPESVAEPEPESPVFVTPTVVSPKTPEPNDHSAKIVFGSFAMIGVIVAVAIVALVFSSGDATNSATNSVRPTPVINTASVIPMRVIDPLGGENDDDLDDLMASWEVEEKEIDASTVTDITGSKATEGEPDLNVSAALLADRQKVAMEPRNGETGIRPSGLNVPKELFGDGVIKQKAKLREMNESGYQQPLDFGDLAIKRIGKELIEMPMAGESYYLDVGGSASDGPFMSFAFPNVRSELAAGNPKFDALVKLASDFSGQKYDLSNAAHRKQMRIRLLRMFNKLARPILLELAGAYHGKFKRPLRVTSLTRSMDYQIGLNATNANSFPVRGPGSLPPHTSGCAFDLARKHMTAEEQNFVMNKLAEMENAGKLDALIEYGANACFHVFIYSDGRPPKM